MAHYCPECGGELRYDSRLRRYVCKSCGLFLSSQELMEFRDRMTTRIESDEEKKKRKHKDYLKWWFSEKD